MKTTVFKYFFSNLKIENYIIKLYIKSIFFRAAFTQALLIQQLTMLLIPLYEIDKLNQVGQSICEYQCMHVCLNFDWAVHLYEYALM